MPPAQHPPAPYFAPLIAHRCHHKTQHWTPMVPHGTPPRFGPLFGPHYPSSPFWPCIETSDVHQSIAAVSTCGDASTGTAKAETRARTKCVVCGRWVCMFDGVQCVCSHQLGSSAQSSVDGVDGCPHRCALIYHGNLPVQLSPVSVSPPLPPSLPSLPPSLDSLSVRVCAFA